MNTTYRKLTIFTFSLLILGFSETIEAWISSPVVNHIKERHWHYSNSNTSKFYRNMTIGKLDHMAQKTIQNGSARYSIHGQGRSTHQYRFYHPIGVSAAGKKAYSLRVVTDGRGNVITAFPVGSR